MDDFTCMQFIEVPVIDPCVPDLARRFEEFCKSSSSLSPAGLADVVRPALPPEAPDPVKKRPSVLERLLEAKAHSDRGDYARKNAILRDLMKGGPGDWVVDQPVGKYQGVTHAPTGFRLHAPRDVTAVLKSGFDDYVPSLVMVKRADDDRTPFTIAVDLDGTLAEKEEPFSTKSIGKPRERAVFWVRLFHAAGARIIIFTVRGTDELVEGWLKEHDVPYDFVNENPDQPAGSSGKVIADAYWDDRAYNAEDPDESGPVILQKLLSRGADEKSEKAPSGASVTVSVSRTTYIVAAPELLEALESEDGE